MGAIVPALVWDDGWGARAGLWRDTLRTRDVDAISNTRFALTEGAIDTIRSRPLVGVGPGRYTPESQPPVGVGESARGEIVHNLPLYTAATGGIPAGIVVLALLMGAAVVAARAGPLTLAVYLAYLPFVLLDRFPYDGVQGLALTGVWFGAVGLLSRLEHEAQRLRRAASSRPAVSAGRGMCLAPMARARLAARPEAGAVGLLDVDDDRGEALVGDGGGLGQGGGGGVVAAGSAWLPVALPSVTRTSSGRRSGGGRAAGQVGGQRGCPRPAASRRRWRGSPASVRATSTLPVGRSTTSAPAPRKVTRATRSRRW